MKDKFKEYACEFKNEDECEEELKEDELSLEKVDKEHYDEEYLRRKEAKASQTVNKKGLKQIKENKKLKGG